MESDCGKSSDGVVPSMHEFQGPWQNNVDWSLVDFRG